MTGYKRVERIKFCVICAKRMNPDNKNNYHDSCKKIRDYNQTKKIRKYPTTDCFIFDSLRYHQVAQDMNAKGLAYNKQGYCYIALSNIAKECSGMSEIDFLKHICRTISHEMQHLVLYQLIDNNASFRYDCIWIKIKLNGYEGIKMQYMKDTLKRLHEDYVKRSKAMLGIK